jgi:hypothetical protein
MYYFSYTLFILHLFYLYRQSERNKFLPIGNAQIQ